MILEEIMWFHDTDVEIKHSTLNFVIWSQSCINLKIEQGRYINGVKRKLVSIRFKLKTFSQKCNVNMIIAA